MSKITHVDHLNSCLEIAKSSVENGNHPFGALLVLEDLVIMTSENEVNTRKDVTAHAELLLVQKAQKFLNSDQLAESILYTSTEPCAMCAGAIYWVGIKNVVYGCSTTELFNIVGEGLYLKSTDLYSQSTDPVNVSSASQRGNFLDLHKSYWRS